VGDQPPVITALGGVTFTTKKLKEHTAADVAASLAEIRDPLSTSEQIEKDVHPKVVGYERSVSLLRGLNQRGDRRDSASAPTPTS
jgi:hypothetical protein